MKVMITGAGGGIGSACVLQLAAKEGVEIIAVSRSATGLEKLRATCISKYGKSITIIASDFRKQGFEQRIAEEVAGLQGDLDCLINNAGVLVNKAFEELNAEEITEQLTINFTAPAALIRSLLPFMINRIRPSHVVNISSMGGYQGSSKFSGLSLYSAAKGALAVLTECLAVEYMDSGVRFNCLALGSVQTEMLKKAFPGYTTTMQPGTLAEFIVEFALTGQHYFNGKIIPVSGIST